MWSYWMLAGNKVRTSSKVSCFHSTYLGKSKNAINEVFPYKTSMGTRQMSKAFVNLLCTILIESISTIIFPVGNLHSIVGLLHNVFPHQWWKEKVKQTGWDIWTFIDVWNSFTSICLSWPWSSSGRTQAPCPPGCSHLPCRTGRVWKRCKLQES